MLPTSDPLAHEHVGPDKVRDWEEDLSLAIWTGPKIRDPLEGDIGVV